MSYVGMNEQIVDVNAIESDAVVVAAKGARKVFAWVRLTLNDGAYVQLKRQAALEAIKAFAGQDIQAEIRDGDLYID